MYAVLDTTTGKYLKRFSGSLNNREFTVRCSVRQKMNLSWNQSSPEVDVAVKDAMWTSNKNEAKLYASPAAVSNSFYSERYDQATQKYKSMTEALPHLQIVEVTIK
jgi:hypothetical protein